MSLASVGVEQNLDLDLQIHQEENRALLKKAFLVNLPNINVHIVN